MIANVRTAKARLSELLERAAAGEEIVITSGGRARAKLGRARFDSVASVPCQSITPPETVKECGSS